MRSAALAFTTSAALLAGCLGNFDLDLDLDLGGCWFGSPCVSPEDPVAFTQDESALALGGTADVEVLVYQGFQLKLRSTDPSVLSVEETAPGVFVMHGLAKGVATIEATDGTPNPARIFASHTMSVDPIATVDFSYRPNGEGALTRLAGLANAREAVHVTARSMEGAPLAGAESLLELAFTGVQNIPATSTEQRFISFDLFSVQPSVGFDVGVAFGALGQGSIVASVGGEVLATLPVDVIPSAALVELRPTGGATTVTVGSAMIVNIVGFDAQGTPVAGLVGDWSASPAELVEIDRPTKRGETFIIANKVGVVTITATLPDRQVSRQITIQ